MVKNYCLTILIAFIVVPGFTQNLTQTVRGTILDTDSKLPLIGVGVIVDGTNPIVGTSTNVNGEFRLENIPVGRITLQLSYLGYETVIIPNIVVNSGKEVFLNLNMRESFLTMEDLVVRPDMRKGEALNEMAMVSARSISTEETTRYPGGFNDPSRILSNFAGINNSQDGSTDIIVRGNSPKYVQWRLEGVPITNPNHFADQNATGNGGLSTLNNNLLATSDFYTGAFSPQYGNVLSGVYEVNLRPGNNEKFESVFGFGLLGTDLTLEGPFQKDYDGSYLINYRYSNIALVEKLGMIPDIGGIPRFQDAAFKVDLPTKTMGRFSLFGLSGLSNLNFKDVSPLEHQTPGNRGQNPGISEDFNKDSHLLNLGLKHTFTINSNSYIQSAISFSNEGIADDVFESQDSVLNKHLNFSSRLIKSAYRAAITYNHKLSSKNNFQTGTEIAFFDYEFAQSQLRDDSNSRFILIDFRENVGSMNNFISWQHRFNENITVVTGLHNMNVLFNNKNTLEPRIAAKWHLSPSGSLHAGYGKHSHMESIHHYFARIEQENGNIIEPNRDLDLLKAHHYVLGYEQRLGRNLMAKVEFYFQNLYDLPVENNKSSNFATINEGLDFKYADLVNEGTGRNYGVEVTVEHFFGNNYYFLINGTLYDSKYTALDGVERNTKFNGNYLANIIAGKEFVNLGKRKNNILAINAKAFFGGGQKIIPLLRDDQGNLAVDPASNRFWDYDRAYEKALDNLYSITISGSYKWNKPQATHELFIDLINITDKQGRLSEFYDEGEPDSIGYVTQPFFFPNLMYRVYF